MMWSAGGFWKAYLQPDFPVKTVLKNVPVVCCSDTVVTLDSAFVLYSVSCIADVPLSDSQYYYYDGLVDERCKHLAGQNGNLSVLSGQTYVLIHMPPGGKKIAGENQTWSCGMVTIVDDEPDVVYINISLSSQDLLTSEQTIDKVALTGHDSVQSGQVKMMLLHQALALCSGYHDIGYAGVTCHRIEQHDSTAIR